MRRDRVRQKLGLAALIAALLASCAPVEPPSPVVATTPSSTMGGARMDPASPIIDNASKSRDHTKLVAALRAAGLAETLSGPGDFTIFAPTNSAFDRLPPSTVETLMDAANKMRLANLLRYHVLPGRKTRSEIIADIQAGGGTASYRTQAGGVVRARLESGNIILWDNYNHRSVITQADVMHSNGVVHVVDTVLLPALS